ncbi:MAG: tetratricopeptide repeat protein [Bacteroidota bacterium]
MQSKYINNLFLLVSILVFACQNDEKSQEAAQTEMLAASGKPKLVKALDGTPLAPIILSTETKELYEKKLVSAIEAYHENPIDINNIIWYGRRKAYLGYYWLAIKIYSEGINLYPDSSQLYRHRGHRYITVREFDQAIEDFEVAALLCEKEENFIEPDGLPNKLGVPLSNNKFNIYYHLGLAYYLKGDFYKALEAYRKCMEFSNNDDLLIATSDWLYMTYIRLGLEAEALSVLEKINSEIEVVENDAYLKRLLMYKGLVEPETLLNNSASEDNTLALVTQGYGVGNWYLQKGDTTKALEIFQSLVAKNYWSAFGHIAAEAELLLLMPAETNS